MNTTNEIKGDNMDSRNGYDLFRMCYGGLHDSSIEYS
jgi:hypothetical protein